MSARSPERLRAAAEYVLENVSFATGKPVVYERLAIDDEVHETLCAIYGSPSPTAYMSEHRCWRIDDGGEGLGLALRDDEDDR